MDSRGSENQSSSTFCGWARFVSGQQAKLVKLSKGFPLVKYQTHLRGLPLRPSIHGRQVMVYTVRRARAAQTACKSPRNWRVIVAAGLSHSLQGSGHVLGETDRTGRLECREGGLCDVEGGGSRRAHCELCHGEHCYVDESSSKKKRQLRCNFWSLPLCVDQGSVQLDRLLQRLDDTKVRCDLVRRVVSHGHVLSKHFYRGPNYFYRLRRLPVLAVTAIVHDVHVYRLSRPGSVVVHRTNLVLGADRVVRCWFTQSLVTLIDTRTS